MENEEIKEEKEKKTVSVSTTPEIRVYLKTHPNLKKSKVFQDAMYRIMKPRRNPLLLMMGVLGVCFSIVCLAIAVSGLLLFFGQQGFILSTIFFCVGCAVLTASVLTFYKDRTKK